MRYTLGILRAMKQIIVFKAAENLFEWMVDDDLAQRPKIQPYCPMIQVVLSMGICIF